MRTVMVVWGLLLSCTASLDAQRLPEPSSYPSDDTLGIAEYQPRPHSEGVLFLAGAGGMIAGALGGGFIGVQIDEDSGLDAAEGAIIGGLIGTTLATPAAVHLANGRRGNLGRSVLVSALVGGGIFALGWAAESGELVLAAPLAQLITSVVIERNTSR
jgi:hypothetical protein